MKIWYELSEKIYDKRDPYDLHYFAVGFCLLIKTYMPQCYKFADW